MSKSKEKLNRLREENRNLDLTMFDQESILGEIKEVSQGILRDFIDEEYWPKFMKEDGTDNLDREVIHLEINTPDKDLINDNLTIPKIQGYQKSNLKKFRDKNPELSVNPSEWIGAKVKLQIEAKGQKTFLKLAF